MADKTNKKGASKILKIFGVLVLIVIVVVAIVLLVPKDKGSLTDTMMSTEQNMLLDDQEEAQDYSALKTKLSSSNISYYEAEAEALEDIADAVDATFSFYNDVFKYSKNNSVMSKQYDTVKGALSSAKKSKTKLVGILDESAKSTEQTKTYLRNTWLDFRSEFSTWLSSFETAFNGLYKIYCGCNPNSIGNNMASRTDLAVVNDYISSLSDEIKSAIKSDTKNSNKTYSLTYKAIAAKFDNFTSAKFNNNAEIESYYFSDSVKEKFDKIGKFFEVYKESSFKPLIASINSVGTITKTYDNVVDNDGILTIVKAYLGGG